MEIIETIAAFRQARARFGRLGLVPTMGYLHDGHLSLVRQARAECGAVAVSIFVNPTQFGPREDLSRYPRDLERDLRLLREENVDLVFVPSVAEIYPPGFSTFVDVRDVTEMLEGAVRPGHFQRRGDGGVQAVQYRAADTGLFWPEGCAADRGGA